MSNTETGSAIAGLYRLKVDERRRAVAAFASLDEAHLAALDGGLDLGRADRMVENVIGTYSLPVGVATNFRIDGVDRLVAMVIEEPSVIAAASNGAKVARPHGGFTTSRAEHLMIGQIQVTGLRTPRAAAVQVGEHEPELIEAANACDPMLASLGGGARRIETRVLATDAEPMLVCHLLVECLDAMGANAVNTMVERIGPTIERITGGRTNFRIISNLADARIVSARAVFDVAALATVRFTGDEVADRIVAGYQFALHDPHRAATHNKGIMNGVSAVVLATGNDTRAVEAGAHAYAATATGRYSSLTHYERTPDGNIVGVLTMPMAVGIIGGATAVHPGARAALSIMGIEHASELESVMAAVGLAQNFAGLRALASTGIQHGHMRLHARTIAMSVGAEPGEVDELVRRLVEGGAIRMDVATTELARMREG